MFQRARSVLTIHNIGYQGVVPAAQVSELGLGTQTHLLHQEDLKAGFINPLKHGILYADALTTVSPTHAREILTPQYGMGLQELLRSRAGALHGILNGVDYSVWDPRADRFLPQHYGPDTLDGKTQLKRLFLERTHLAGNPDAPLLGIIGRFVEQKGFELLFETLPKLLQTRNLSVVALGSGEARYEQFFARLQRDYAHRVAYHRGHHEQMAHWIEAASDMFVMPSLYEPCGLNQMYSLRYGTVPIVRRTGGLADSVQHYDMTRREGTGFVFEEFSAAGLMQALSAALDLFAQPSHWRALQLNGMRQDFSWERQTARYVALYEKLIGT